jgi:hypothetical protein
MKNVQKHVFAQKMTKLWACQISQNKKKHPVDTQDAAILLHL